MQSHQPAEAPMEHQPSERLREHPDPRFAGMQHAFDLEALAAQLRQEFQAGEEGHRQESLYKHGSTTVALFVFGHLTGLPPHRTTGVVIIQVLKGYLQITAEGQVHDLHAGKMLVLAPGVEHGLVAYEESEMLLTVHLNAAPASPAR